jgi:iron complex outermembrane receptor protein
MARSFQLAASRTLLSGLLLGLLSAGPALAAESANTSHLGDITVTATKTATPAELLPVTAYSVDQKEIEAQPSYYMSNFGELIRDLPGVHVAQYYPWGPPWVHLRGTGYFIGRTAFLVDGVPVTPFMSQTINNNDIARVDVLLGPSSALYGANASGGAVNIITKSGKDQRAAKAGVGYGSYDTWRTHASVGDRQGAFDYYFSYNGDYSGGYGMKPVEGMIDLYKRGKTQYLWDASYENNRYEYNYMMGKAGWTNSSGAGLVASYNYETLYLYGGQPGLVLNDNGPQLAQAAIERIRSYAGSPAAFDTVSELEQYFRTVYKPYGWLSDAQWRRLTETSVRRLSDGRVTPHYDPAMVMQFTHHGADMNTLVAVGTGAAVRPARSASPGWLPTPDSAATAA